MLVDNLTRAHDSLIDAARIVEAEAGIVVGAMTIVVSETGPAPFRVSAISAEPDLVREGLRQGFLTPAHLTGPSAGAATDPPADGSDPNQS